MCMQHVLLQIQLIYYRQREKRRERVPFLSLQGRWPIVCAR